MEWDNMGLGGSMNLGYEDDLLRSTGSLEVSYSDLPLVLDKLSYINGSIKGRDLSLMEAVSWVRHWINFLIGQNYYYVLRPDFDCINDYSVPLPLNECILYIYTAIGLLSLEYDGEKFKLVVI
jgi:hypothetical protein